MLPLSVSLWWVSTILETSTPSRCAAELQQGDQAAVEDVARLDGGVAVVENLRQEGVEALEGAEVVA